MKKFFLLTMLFTGLLFTSSCSDDEEPIEYSKNDFLLDNNITDVELFDTLTVKNEINTVMYYGFRNHKEWYALFDKESKKIITQWVGRDSKECPSWGIEGLHAIKINREKEYSVNFLGPAILKKSGDVKYWESSEWSTRIVDVINDSLLLSAPLGFYNDVYDDYYDYSNAIIYDTAGNIYTKNLETYINYENKRTDCYVGIKDNRIWCAYKDSTGLYKSALDDGTFNVIRKIHTGYGKYIERDLNYGFKIEKLFKTKGGFICCLANNDRNYDEFKKGLNVDFIIFNENKLNYLSGWLNPYQQCYDLYAWNNCVVLENFRLNDIEADKLNYLMLSDGSLNEIKTTPTNDAIPLSLDEGIEYKNGKLYCMNYVSGIEKWETEFKDIATDAKRTLTVTGKHDIIWTFSMDILNLDGSREILKFNVNIKDGTLTYIN